MIGKKYTESGGFDMNRVEFRMAQMQVINNPKYKQGLELFEKHIGRIEWLHPKEELDNIKSDKKYAVLNPKGEIIFEADKLFEIAKEFCVTTNRISNCLNLKKLLNERYIVVRCENE